MKKIFQKEQLVIGKKLIERKDLGKEQDLDLKKETFIEPWGKNIFSYACGMKDRY